MRRNKPSPLLLCPLSVCSCPPCAWSAEVQIDTPAYVQSGEREREKRTQKLLNTCVCLILHWKKMTLWNKYWTLPTAHLTMINSKRWNNGIQRFKTGCHCLLSQRSKRLEKNCKCLLCSQMMIMMMNAWYNTTFEVSHWVYYFSKTIFQQLGTVCVTIVLKRKLYGPII